MRKLVAGLAITLDGVTEAPSWMRFDAELAAIIGAGVAQADAILLGRRTYLEFAQLWPAQPATNPMADFMNNTPKYIVSQTLKTLEWNNSTLLSGALVDEVGALKQLPGKNIQVPGSPALVRALLELGLLDELSLMIHPVLLGTGARLFQDLHGRLELELVESRALASGLVSATYRPAA